MPFFNNRSLISLACHFNHLWLCNCAFSCLQNIWKALGEKKWASLWPTKEKKKPKNSHDSEWPTISQKKSALCFPKKKTVVTHFILSLLTQLLNHKCLLKKNSLSNSHPLSSSPSFVCPTVVMRGNPLWVDIHILQSLLATQQKKQQRNTHTQTHTHTLSLLFAIYIPSEEARNASQDMTKTQRGQPLSRNQTHTHILSDRDDQPWLEKKYIHVLNEEQMRTTKTRARSTIEREKKL
jgi:hypothetical protein